MTTNTRYNPIFRATHAAFSELTTPEARRWYWQQLQTSAVLAQKITLQGVTLARRWIGVSRGPVAIDLVEEHDVMAPEPAAVSAPAATVALELGDIAATLTASEANDTPIATLSEQAIAVVEPSAATADLGPEPESLDLAATEQTTATDYESLDDSQELLTEADEPLVDDVIPFTDDLESGPPFQEEDDSFFDPDEDSSDSLLEDDLEPVASVLPSDLNERVEAYLKSHDISAEPEHESSSHSFAPAISHSSSGAEFGL